MRISCLRQKVFTLLIAASSLVVSTVFGALPDISINFPGCCNDGTNTPTTLLPSEVAGVVPRSNWNNVSGNNVHDAVLNDSSGTPTAVTIYFDADESWGSGAGYATSDRKMLNGYLGISNDGHYRPLFLNNVPNGAYKLIMYNGRGDNQPQGYTVNPASVNTHLSIMPEGAFTDTWIRGTSTNPNARDVCNYVQFDEVAPVNGTITIDCRSESFRGMMNGIQLISLAPGAFRFVNQPADVTTDEGTSASFHGGAVDGAGAVTYQWLTNGVVDPSNVTQTYSRPVLNANENARTFALVATDSTSQSVTSRVATLTVNNLTILVSASSNGRTNRVFARFGAFVALSGTYTLNNGASVYSASYGATHKDIVLDTSILIDGAIYTLTATGETREDNGNPTVPDPNTINFIHGFGEFCSDFASLPAGAALFNNGVTGAGQLADDGTGTNNVIHLNDDGNNGAYGKLYITNRTLGANINVLDAHWRVRIGGDLGGHADGMTFSWANNLATDGNFVAVEEGEGNGVSFVIDTWDGGSGPDTGIDIKWLGAQLPGSFLHIPRSFEGNDNFICKDVFVDASASVNSAGVAKFTYNGNTVSAVIPGWTGIANGAFVFSARTGGENDNFWIDDVCINKFTLGPVFFTLEPVSQTVLEGLTATFSAAVDGSPSYSYQWYSNGVAIAGATTPSYTTPPVTEAYQGRLYSVVASNEFSSVTSSNAVLGVDVSPRVVSVSSSGTDKVKVVYTRNVDLGPNLGPPFYDFNNGAFEGSRAYGANHKEVVITTDAALTVNLTYILSISDVNSEGDPGSVLLPNPTDVAFHHGYGSFCANFDDNLVPVGSSALGSTAVSGGFLHLTDAANGLQGNFFVADPNGGFPVDRLLVKFKTQLGGGTCCGTRYADGMSFNVDSSITAGSTYGEEGFGSGLTITFDTWDNAAPDTAPAIEVRYHGAVVAVQSMAGNREDARPLATPFVYDANGNALSLDTSNTFVNVLISIAPDGKLDLYYRDQIIFQNLQLPGYTPFVGANFGFGARTGGANENAWIDDLCINAFSLGAVSIVQEPADASGPELPAPRLAFYVGVDGLPPYSVQWYSNNVIIPGATALNYFTSPLRAAASGSQYKAVISNGLGTVTTRSAIATLTVIPRNSISVNFEGGNAALAPTQLLPTDAAGVVALPNWKNINGNTAVNVPLNDYLGAVTPVTISFQADESWGSGTDDPATGDPNYKMLNGYLGISNDGNYRPLFLNNVPDGAYKLIIYNVQDGRQDNGYTINADTINTLHITHEGEGDWLGVPAFRRAVSTNPNARDVGNYVQFDNVQAIGGTITIDCRSESFRGIMNGLQLIPADPGAFRIVNQPQDATRDTTQSATFIASTVDGVGAVTYQWFTNGVADTTAGVASTYVYSGIVAGDNGRTFQVQATDSTATIVSSRTAVLTVTPFRFANLNQPADVILPVGQNATFSVGVISGNAPYTYQWLTNGVVDPSGTGSSYTLNSVTFADSGRAFQVTVTDALGTPINSRVATLTVVDHSGRIAVSFTGRGDPCCGPHAIMAPSELAGVLAQGNWNNADNSAANSGVAGPLNNGNGTPTTVTLTYLANDSWNNDGPSNPGNERMMKGISKQQNVDTAATYTFNNVPPGRYNVYVYCNVNGDGRNQDIIVGGVTNYLTEQHQFGGTFIESVNTSPSGTRTVANYVKFLYVSPDQSGNIVVTAVNRSVPDGNGISGLQIIQAAAPAQVAVSFTGRGDCAPGCSTLAPATAAGLLAQANWNNIDNSGVFNGTSAPLNSSSGASTTVTLTYDANDSWNNDGPSGSGNEQLFKGISKANGTDRQNIYTFNDVPPGKYDLVVYLNVNGDGRIGDISCGGQTYYFTSQHAFGGSFLQITNTSPGAVRDTGNYVRFLSVSPDALNKLAVSFINRGDADGVGIAGFQLAPASSQSQLAVSFTGRGDCAPACSTLAPTDVAGVAAQGNWNNIVNDAVFNGVSGPLNDLNGVGTLVTLTYNANDAWNNDGASTSPNEKLYKGISKSFGANNQNTYIFNNVRPGNYDVIVYLNVNGDGRIGDLSCNGITYYYTSQHSFAGSFIQITNSSAAATRDTGNYVRFYNVPANGANQILLSFINRGDPDGVGIAGFQLLPGSPAIQLAASFTGRGDCAPGCSTLAPTTVAGVVAQPNWNNIDNSGVFNGVTGPLNASNGVPTTTTLVYDANDSWNNDQSPVVTGDQQMMKGISKANGANRLNTYTFKDVRPGLWDVIVLLNVNGDGRIGDFSCNGQTFYITSQHQFGGTFIPGVNTSPGGPRDVCNYVRFYGVNSGAAGRITVTMVNRGDPDGTGIAGFELVPSSAPVLLSADSRLNPNGVRLTFTVAMGASALNPANYTLDGGISVNSVSYVGTSSNLIQLATTPAFVLGNTYTVTAANVQDTASINLAPNPTSKSFLHGAGLNAAAGLTVKIYNGANSLGLLNAAIAACATPTFSSSTINERMEYTTSARGTIAEGNTFLLPNTENYGTWIYGVFVAPANGNYQFALAADDNSQIFLSSDASPANKVLIASQPAWNGYREYITSGGTVVPVTAPIALVAGRSYYMETRTQEGGGGDNVSVAVRLPGGPAIVNGTLPIPRSMFATNYSIGCPPTSFFNTLGPILITEQPVNQTVNELFAAKFYIGLDGTPAYTVQWYSNTVAVPGATSQTYNPVVNRSANGSQWFAIVANEFSSAISAVATLTVISDEVAPAILSARGSDSFTNATIVFNEPVQVSSATTLANYTITNSAGVTQNLYGVLLRDNTNVVLHTEPQTQGERYTIVLSNVADRAGIPNPVAANSTVSFSGWVFSPGFALMETYGDSGGTTIPMLLSNPLYPHYPRERFYMTTPNSRNAYPDDSHGNYGGRISGLMIPPVSGNYQFSINNDDDALLRGALTDNSGDLQDIGAQPCCSGTFRNTGPALPLTAGNRYAYQLLWKEGGGGDYAALSADGINPIPADYLAVYANPDALSLVITTDLQPEYTRIVNQSPTLTVAATVTSFDGAVRPLLYQWYSNGVAMAGATGPSHTTPPLQVVNEGDVYSCLARTPGATLLSVVSTQHVSEDIFRPYLVSVRTDETFTKIYLTWSELMTEGTAAEESSYRITDPSDNEITVIDAAYAGSNVVLNLASPMFEGTIYTVDIGFQLDLVGNPTDPVGLSLVDFDYGVVTNVSSWVASPCGGVEFSLFSGLSTGDNNIRNTLLADPRFPNNPTAIYHISGMSSRLVFPNDSVEGYGARMRGLFIPPTSGNWIFYIRSDDSSILYMNTNGPSAAGKVIVQEEAGCCGAFAGHPTAPITLVAGQGYYMEMVYKEGTGGDYAFTAARLQGQPAPTSDATDPIPGTMMGSGAAPGGIGGALNLGLQPVDTTTTENNTVTFTSTFVSPNDLPICYQWRRDNIDIPGANGPSYTTPNLTLLDNGAVFSVQASIIGAKTTSTNATLSVITDTVVPIALGARGVRSQDAIKITFNEAMASGPAVEVGNYEVTDTNGSPIVLGTPILSGDARTVTLPTAALNPGTVYNVTIGNAFLTDLAGNPLGGTNFQVTTWTVGLGSLLFEAYNTGGGNDVSILTGHPSYPNSPDFTQHIDRGDSRRAYPSDAREGYGARLSGYFVPQQTTNYTFYLRSDDASRLQLSTDSSPANLVTLTEELACCTAFSAHASASISLVAGQSYYMELLYKEGVGGDYGQVAVKRTSSPQDPNTLSTINGGFLSSLADPMGASITITQQPLSQLFPVAATPVPLLSENFNSGDGGFTVSTPQGYDAPWAYSGGSGSWIEDGQGPDNGHGNVSKLASPVVTTTAAGNVVVSFSHRYSFEFDGTAWDGGQLRVSINGGPTNTVAGSAFTQNPYNGTAVAIGSPSWTATSAGHGIGTKITSTADLGYHPAGTTIRIEFYAGNDSNTKGATPNWEIDSVDISQGSSPLNVSLSVGFTATNDYGDYNQVAYQWQQNLGGVWKNLIGQNGPTFVTVPPPGLVADYRVIVYIPGASAVSATAQVVGQFSFPWSGGILQWADEVAGPWTDVPSPINPFIYDTRLGPKKFWKVRTP